MRGHITFDSKCRLLKISVVSTLCQFLKKNNEKFSDAFSARRRTFVFEIPSMDSLLEGTVSYFVLFATIVLIQQGVRLWIKEVATIYRKILFKYANRYLQSSRSSRHSQGEIRYGGIRQSSSSPRPPCDGTPSASVCPSPRQTPGPSCPEFKNLKKISGHFSN